MPPTCHPCLRRATTSLLVAVALISGAILLLGDRFDVTPGYALTQSVRVTTGIAACVADESMRLINTDQEQCRAGELELASDSSGPPATASATSVAGARALPGPAGPPGPSGPPGPAGPPGPPGPAGPSALAAKAPGAPGAPGRTAVAAGGGPVAQGPAGAAGPSGPPGPAGRAGADGVSGFEIVTAKVAIPGRQAASGEARCPAGKVALGGGVLPDPESPRKAGAPEDRMDVVVSAPLLPGGDAGYGWTATVRNTGTVQLSVVVAAICVTLR